MLSSKQDYLDNVADMAWVGIAAAKSMLVDVKMLASADARICGNDTADTTVR